MWSRPWVGWMMVALPLVSGGFYACVPSVWVAVKRRSDRRAMRRSIVTALAFLAGTVVGALLVDIAPTDVTGTPTGARAYLGIALLFVVAVVSAGLAVVQRDPTLTRPKG